MSLAQGHPLDQSFVTIHSVSMAMFSQDEELPRTSHLYLCLPRAWSRAEAETIVGAWAD